MKSAVTQREGISRCEKESGKCWLANGTGVHG
jgi:hypothetical protein